MPSYAERLEAVAANLRRYVEANEDSEREAVREQVDDYSSALEHLEQAVVRLSLWGWRRDALGWTTKEETR